MVTRTALRSAKRGRRSARRAVKHRDLAGLAQAGLTARGVLYVLIAIIAVQIALEGSRQQADRTGALRLVAHTAFGTIALWLLVIGFAAMTLWRLSEAMGGSAGPDGRKASMRLANLARAVFYAVVTYGILTYALGVGQPASTDRQSRDLTAAALKHPGGQWVVAIAGAIVVIWGLYTMYRAYQLRFLKRLRMDAASARTRTAVTRLGQAGGITRGLVFATVGVFLVIAAKDANPGQAKGIDSALRALAHTPLGPVLLIVIALGLATFGVYSWCEARWRAV
jgi:hypothetical protein